MNQPIHALYIHGIGTEGPHFAYEASGRLRAACKSRGVPYEARYVHWEPVMGGIQRAFLARQKAAGLECNMLQTFDADTAADATLYLMDPGLRAQIYALIDAQVERFYSHPWVCFAHSLGGLLMTDYLRLRPRALAERCHLVTMGCNLGLFWMSQSFGPIPGLTRWCNLVDRNDGVGYFLGCEQGFDHARDVPVDVGITALAHIRFWTDNRLWEETVPGIVLGT